MFSCFAVLKDWRLNSVVAFFLLRRSVQTLLFFFFFGHFIVKNLPENDFKVPLGLVCQIS